MLEQWVLHSASQSASKDRLFPDYWDSFLWPQLVGASEYMLVTLCLPGQRHLDKL